MRGKKDAWFSGFRFDEESRRERIQEGKQVWNKGVYRFSSVGLWDAAEHLWYFDEKKCSGVQEKGLD